MSAFKAPEGWALVPLKPTQDMVNAAKEIDGRLSVFKWADGYAEMLKAAPTPPAGLVGDANKKVAALELSLKAKTEQLSALHKQQDAAREAVASLESERAANAILTDEIARLRFDLENATESRKLAQQALYDARERFEKELLQRTGEVSRLLKERQDCEPFGYFRAEPFGWTDCAPDAEGAIPLYAAPPKREPLSDEQMRKALGTTNDMVRNCMHGPWWPELEQACRAVERAHGIGGQS